MVAACWPDTNLESRFSRSTSTTASFGFPAGYSTGDLLLVAAGISCWDSLPTSPSTPSGWTKLTDNIGDTGASFFEFSRLVVFGKVLDGTEGGSITLTSGGTNFQGWAVATVWIKAKLNGSQLSGWADDYASADNSSVVPALTATRADSIYLYAGHADWIKGLGTPTGFCTLEFDEGGNSGTELIVSVKRISTTGSTGTVDGRSTAIASCAGFLIPAHPYGGLRPTVGYIGLG